MISEICTSQILFLYHITGHLESPPHTTINMRRCDGPSWWSCDDIRVIFRPARTRTIPRPTQELLRSFEAFIRGSCTPQDINNYERVFANLYLVILLRELSAPFFCCRNALWSEPFQVT
jgi:hypothetical protein